MKKSEIRRSKKISRARAKNAVTNRITFDKLTLHRLNWLEWIAIGFSIWFLVHPDPYKILLAILLAIPIIGLFLNGLHRPSMATLVEISTDKGKDDKYDVADFIDVPAWVILLRVLLDFEFESVYSMIVPGTIAAVIIVTLLFFTHRLIVNSNRNKWWIYLSILFNISLYSYAGAYAANCAYDSSAPETYETNVLDKHINVGRKGGKTYYIKVAPWGHHYDKEDIKVSQSMYNQLAVGDKINIDRKKGLFNIPWYYIEGKKR